MSSGRRKIAVSSRFPPSLPVRDRAQAALQVSALEFQETGAEQADRPVESRGFCRLQILEKTAHPGRDMPLKKVCLRPVAPAIRLRGDDRHDFTERSGMIFGLVVAR